MGTWEVDLIATPEGMENNEQQSSSRWMLLIVRPTQSGARLEGLRRSEAAARQQIHASSSRAQKLLGRIKLACFFRDGSSGQPQTP
jgi:hypothetical protein